MKERKRRRRRRKKEEFWKIKREEIKEERKKKEEEEFWKIRREEKKSKEKKKIMKNEDKERIIIRSNNLHLLSFLGSSPNLIHVLIKGPFLQGKANDRRMRIYKGRGRRREDNLMISSEKYVMGGRRLVVVEVVEVIEVLELEEFEFEFELELELEEEVVVDEEEEEDDDEVWLSENMGRFEKE